MLPTLVDWDGRPLPGGVHDRLADAAPDPTVRIVTQLLVALWRYLDAGLVPEGAQMEA